jgi:hypothetical protein
VTKVRSKLMAASQPPTPSWTDQVEGCCAKRQSGLDFLPSAALHSAQQDEPWTLHCWHWQQQKALNLTYQALLPLLLTAGLHWMSMSIQHQQLTWYQGEMQRLVPRRWVLAV